MPISVACPSCSARLTAPDQAAGKAVRCPKCQTPVSVPKPAEDEGFEVIDDTPPVKPAALPAKPAAAARSGERPSQRRPAREEDDTPEDRPSKRRPPADADEAEDDRPSKRRPAADDADDDRPSRSKPRRPADDEDRPRRKGKPAGANLKQRGLIAGIVGGVLFAALIGVMMLQLASFSDSIADRNKFGPAAAADFQKQFEQQGFKFDEKAFKFDDNNNKPAADPKAARPLNVPAGWEKFNDPLNELEIYFPAGQPEKNEAQSQAITNATGGPGDIWMKTVGGKIYTLSRMTVTDADLKANKPEKLLADATMGVRIGVQGAKEESFLNLTTGGKPSRVTILDIPRERKRMVVYTILSGNRMVIAIVAGGPKILRIDGDIFPFQDNIRFLK